MRILLIAALFATTLLLQPQPSRCQTDICPRIPCVNSNVCNLGCACMKPPTQGLGVCVSVR